MAQVEPEEVGLTPGPPPEPQPSRQTLGQFVTIRSLMAALRRRRRFWVLIALVGLILGLAAVFVLPQTYRATTTLELTHNPSDDPTLDQANDLALLETNDVAQAVVTDLKLHESAQAFLGQYQGVAVSTALLQITVEAPSTSSAIARANALDTAFLDIRRALFTSQNFDDATALGLAVAQAQRSESLLAAQYNADKAAGDPTNSPRMAALNDAIGNEANEVLVFDGQITDNQIVTTTINTESRVLDPATALHSSKLKKIIADGGTGVVAGLAIGWGLVAFEAVLFERLRRRDEIADGLGAPVGLAVPDIRPPRLASTWRLRRWVNHPPPSVHLLVGALRGQLDELPSTRGLAVIDVDSTAIAAVSIASLASGLAAEGTEVRLFDLSGGRFLSRLLRLRRPGIKLVFTEAQGSVSLIWQDEAEMAFGAGAADGRHRKDASGTGRASGLTLALVTLDPAIGGRHLIGHVSDAVAIVTVGRSKLSKLRSVAEMLEAAEIRLRSVLVVGSDPDDDSLGWTPPPVRESPTLALSPANLERPERERGD